MPNQFVARNGIFAQSDSQVTGSLQTTGSLGVTGSVEFAYEQVVPGVAAWSAGGSLITARSSLAGAGTQNEALAFGGQDQAMPTTFFTCTEEYNGTSWTAGGALIIGRSTLAGAGTQTAGLAFGGGIAPDTGCTEEYDGTSWTAGGAMIVGNPQPAGTGTQNAALSFGEFFCFTPPSTFSFCNCTEEYDGSTWSTGGPLISSRSFLAGAGTQNAALAFGGSGFTGLSACTEEYDGSTWSTGGTLITARSGLAGAGTQNEALAFGGQNQSMPPTIYACTEEYNGTTWSAGGSLITGRRSSAGAGIQSAGLVFGGDDFSSLLASAEEYNAGSATISTIKTFDYSKETGNITISGSLIVSGSSTLINIGSLQNTGSVAVTQTVTAGAFLNPRTITSDIVVPDNTNALILGPVSISGSISLGTSSSLLVIEDFSNLATTGSNTFVGNQIISGSVVSTQGFTGNLTGTASVALNANIASFALNATSASYALSSSYAPSTPTFPYIGSAEVSGSLGVTGSVGFAFLTSSLGTAVWSAGGALSDARYRLAGVGTQNEALAFGGIAAYATCVGCTEEYNGTSWSTGGTLIIARCALAGAGTQNAALGFGGSYLGYVSCTEEYDGSSWIAAGALITARRSLAGAGTQNAGLAFGGQYLTSLSCTEEYDGTTWTAGGVLINARFSLGGAGTQNAGLALGGTYSAPTALACTEEYNGTSWTTGGALSTARYSLGGAGIQNAGLAFGGRDSSSAGVACTEEYNGTSWTTGGAMITVRYELAGAGDSNSCALAFGGTPGYFACTEEYSPGLTYTAVKTFDYSNTTGITTVTCLIETSAQRYKDNVQELNSQLDKINQLKPVEFDWKNSRKHDIGFIAEDVAGIYPEIVNKNEAGEVEGISYSKMVAALVKAMQEQQQQIANLTREVNDLKNK